jgi:FkbM family methyltransferase
MNNKLYNINGRPIDIYFKVDRFIHEVLEDREYNFLFNDLTTLDLGCNIGTWTFSIYDKIKFGYAIDFSKECIDIMNKTIITNNIKNIKTFCMGISGNSGERNVQTDPEPGLGSWHFTTSNQPAIIVQTIDIKSFLELERIRIIDVMKVDIEGAEHELFESQSFQDCAYKINTIIGEYHGKEPRESLSKAGYYYHRIGSHFIARRYK